MAYMYLNGVPRQGQKPGFRIMGFARSLKDPAKLPTPTATLPVAAEVHARPRLQRQPDRKSDLEPIWIAPMVLLPRTLLGVAGKGKWLCCPISARRFQEFLRRPTSPAGHRVR